jgi:hypothetical protein
MGKDLFLIFFGAALGFILTQLTEWRRTHDERKDKAQRSKQIAFDVSLEALQGIKRCVNLTKGISQKPASLSFGRIYTAFWDSVKDELARNFGDREVLKLLHRIYHRFDLVNFNMQRGKLAVGAAFAKSHLQGMVEDLDNVVCKLSGNQRQKDEV